MYKVCGFTGGGGGNAFVSILILRHVSRVEDQQKGLLGGEPLDAAIAIVCHFSGNKELKT